MEFKSSLMQSIFIENEDTCMRIGGEALFVLRENI